MTDNSKAIAVFCSSLAVGEGLKPLEPRKWSEIALKLMEQSRQPADLLNWTRQDFVAELGTPEVQAEQMEKLLGRSAALAFEISKYENTGIEIITRADKAYPVKLKKKLGNHCPPLFYCAGDTELLNHPVIGFVGSRNISYEDEEFTRKIVHTISQNQYGVVSGGAKGVDSISADEAQNLGLPVIEFISDSMLRKLRNAKILSSIQNGRMLILSEVKPDAGFNAGMAMARNKYIYAQSEATVVVKSDFNQGGTWSGATECLKKRWVPVFCRNREGYPGNEALIEKGAISIDETWDAILPTASWTGDASHSIEKNEKPEDHTGIVQISLFDEL